MARVFAPSSCQQQSRPANVSAAPLVAEGAWVLIVDSNEAELGAVANSTGGDAIAAQWARER